MKVLICGDREWKKYGPIEMIISGLSSMYEESLEIVHGGCRGADNISGEIAAEYIGVEKIHVYPAQWDKYGKPAGIIRNQQMLEEESPELVFAFHNDIASSRGTKHMVKIASEAGVPVYLISEVVL